MTNDFYIDNIENVKISWQEISNVCILNEKSTFLKITVVDNSIIYRQSKNSISKFRFWNTAWNGGILSVNMSLLKGKNNDIVNTIKEYQKNVTNPTIV